MRGGIGARDTRTTLLLIFFSSSGRVLRTLLCSSTGGLWENRVRVWGGEMLLCFLVAGICRPTDQSVS